VLLSLAASLPSPWLGSQLLSPHTPHIPALPWLPACIPGHGDSTGSHNPRQLADLGWRRGTEGLGIDRVRGDERRGDKRRIKNGKRKKVKYK